MKKRNQQYEIGSLVRISKKGGLYQEIRFRNNKWKFAWEFFEITDADTAMIVGHFGVSYLICLCGERYLAVDWRDVVVLS